MGRRRWTVIVLVVLLAGGVAPTSHATATPAQIHAALAPAFTARRASLALLAFTALADVVTTERAFHRGCVESNPIYGGPHPSVGLLLATHGAIVFGAARWRTSTRLNIGGALLFGLVAVHNAGVRCER